jgi:2',3'-cyclic-nucleotide 2'-phosphodiesterase (5'-nucleotidase family)
MKQPYMKSSWVKLALAALFMAPFAVNAQFELQILHASDLEGGVEAIDIAPNFAALVGLFHFYFD